MDPSPTDAEAPRETEVARRPFLASLADSLRGRGLGPVGLAAIAVGLAALGALCLLVRHPGLGGLLGLLALAAGALATQPAGERAGRVDPLARGLQLPVGLVLVGAIVAEAAGRQAGGDVLLGLLALAVVAWLPHLRAVAPPGTIPPAGGLWRHTERIGVLMLGALLGRIAPALLLVVVVGGLDAFLRLDRLRAGGRAMPAPPRFLRPLIAEDGSLEPIVRWGSLLLAVLLLAVLGRPEGWRF